MGVYDTTLGVFLLTDNNTNVAQYNLTLGNPGDTPLAGKWDTTMTHDGAGVFRPSNGLIYLRKALSTGYADYTMILGNPGDRAMAGDWDGNGYDSIGVFRPTLTMYYLANTIAGTTGTPAIVFSNFNFVFGSASNIPVTGDWTNIGSSRVGYIVGSSINLRYVMSAGAPDDTFSINGMSGMPVAGRWRIAPAAAPPRSIAPSVPNIIVQSTVAPTQVPTRPPTKVPQPGDGGGLD